MTSAHVIEVGEVTAGIVVAERGGFRFFASERAFHALEGALFRTPDQAARAARARLMPGRSGQDSLRPSAHAGRATRDRP